MWGQWKLIPALPPGQHVRAAGGDGYGFSVDVTYRLTLADEIPATDPAVL